MNYRDQAFKLRKLASARTRRRILPRVLVVGAGMPNVGCSATSLHVAMAMARLGRRIALIDGELTRPALAAYCGLSPQLGLADMLLARRGIHEVIVPGPAGMQLVAGGQVPDTHLPWTSSTQQRLLEQLSELHRHVDLVVLHMGTQMRSLDARLWTAVDLLLLVTTTGADSLMNAYSAVKHMRDSGGPLPDTRAVVTGVDDDAAARDVLVRLQASCRRFLKLEIAAAGTLPTLSTEVPRAPANSRSETASHKPVFKLAATLVEALDGMGEKYSSEAA